MKTITYFKRTACLLFALITMFSLATFTASAATASDAKNGVVAVVSDYGVGTGFAIGQKGKPVQYIVTNEHVINGSNSNIVSTTATVYFSLASNKQMSASVYYYNKEKDIAILKLPEPTTEREPLVLCAKDKLNPDDDYFALGYPGDSIELTEWLQFSQNDITVTRGGIKKNDTYNGLDIFYLDLTIKSGNSGGPLVNSKGEVAGINKGAVVAVDAAGNVVYTYENVAICINELIRILKTEEIPFSQHGDINWLLVAGAAVLFVIIVLVIVLIVMKNRKSHIIPVVPPRPMPTAELVALGGVLNGRRFPISGVVKIGRNSNVCTVVFPEQTQGVSRIHCEISFNGSVCYIKDLNSSYGTYTMDGKKLVPNTPCFLRSGDRFYIASEENTFTISF